MKQTVEQVNNWIPETKSLINRLIDHGFTIVSGHNGEEGFAYDRSKPMVDFVEELIACDEANLYVTKSGEKFRVYLVLGNSPGEIVCDYGYPKDSKEEPELDKVVMAHSDYWTGRKQPKCNRVITVNDDKTITIKYER